MTINTMFIHCEKPRIKYGVDAVLSLIKALIITWAYVQSNDMYSRKATVKELLSQDKVSFLLVLNLCKIHPHNSQRQKNMECDMIELTLIVPKLLQK